MEIEVLQYVTSDGRCPFEEWFDELDPDAAARVSTAIARMAAGNPGDSKSLGKGLWERRLDFDGGYRLYFVRDGRTLVVLLIGGTKRRQKADISEAYKLLSEYQSRRKQK
jgi:putative addiction module killer protein